MQFREKKWKIGRILLLSCGIVIVIVITLIVKRNLSQRERQKEIYRQKVNNAIEEYEKRPVVTDAPYPKKKKTESRYSLNDSKEEYGFVVENIDELVSNKIISEEQERELLNALQEYLDNNTFEGNSTHLSIMEETVYSYKNKFGMVLCLNNDLLDYVKITGEGKKIVCKDENYGEPVGLLKEDAKIIESIHQKNYPEYNPDLKYNQKDFPYSKKDMARLVRDYYADMSGNYYLNYKKYGVGVKAYMQKEWDYFHYSYATYKYNTDQLKKEISSGDQELYKNGTIKASVKGYMLLYATNIVARVELNMCYKSKKASEIVYVTLISDGKHLLLLPEDRSVEEYWDYKYKY